MKEQEPPKVLNVISTALTDGKKRHAVLIFRDENAETIGVVRKKTHYTIADLARVTGLNHNDLRDRIWYLSPHNNTFNVYQNPTDRKLLFMEGDFIELAKRFFQQGKAEKPKLPPEKETLTLPDGRTIALTPDLLTTKLAKAVLALHQRGETFTRLTFKEFLSPDEYHSGKSLVVALGKVRRLFEENTDWTIVNLTSRREQTRNHVPPFYKLRKMDQQTPEETVEQPAPRTQDSATDGSKETIRWYHQEIADPYLFASRKEREPTFNEIEEMRTMLKIEVTYSLLDFYEKWVDQKSGAYKNSEKLDVYVFIESMLEIYGLYPSFLTFLTDKWFNQNGQYENGGNENRGKLKNAILKLFEEGLTDRINNVKAEPCHYYDENARRENEQILTETRKFLA